MSGPWPRGHCRWSSDAYNPQALLAEHIRDRQASVAADGDQSIDLVLLEQLHDFIRAVPVNRQASREGLRYLEGIALVDRSQNGAPEVADVPHDVRCQTDQPAVRVILRVEKSEYPSRIP